jgi:hypothetical protein
VRSERARWDAAIARFRAEIRDIAGHAPAPEQHAEVERLLATESEPLVRDGEVVGLVWRPSARADGDDSAHGDPPPPPTPGRAAGRGEPD